MSDFLNRLGSVGSRRRGSDSGFGTVIRQSDPRHPLSDYQQNNLSYYDDLFRNTEYWDLYQSIVNQYSKPVPNTMLGSLTGQDDMNEYNRRQQMMAALTALASQMRTDEYNSPANQAALEKAAGLNPDITGISGTGQTDSPQLPEHMPVAFENPIPHMVSFLSMIGNAVAGSQAMVSQSLINDGMRLQNLSTADNIVLGELGRMNLDPLGADIMPAFKIGFNTGSRSLNKRLESRAQGLYDTISHKIATKTNQKDLAKIRKDTFDVISSAGYSEDDNFYDELASRMADAYQKILELEQRNRKQGLGVESQRLSNESEFLNEVDPITEAQAQNETNTRSRNKDKQWNEFFNIQKGILGYIRSQAKKGDTGAIDLIFRIFGENVGTNDRLSALHQSNAAGLGTITNLFK